MNGRCSRFGNSRRATAIAQTVVFAVLSGSSVVAWAGGMQFDEDPRIERREARWRAHPVAVLPELARQVCTGGASTITAKELLEEVGARAVAPLLRELTRDRFCNRGAEVVAHILCEAQAREGGRHVTAAFAPLKAALSSSRWSEVEAGLGAFSWIGDRPSDTPGGDDSRRGWDWECTAREPLLDAAVPVFRRLLNARAGAERETVVTVLGNLGSRAAPLVPQLMKLLEDPDCGFETALTLGTVGPAAAVAAPAIAALLARTDDESRRMKLASALGEMGPAAAVALPQLQQRLQAAAAAACASPAGFPWFMHAMLRIGPPAGQPAEVWRKARLDELRQVLVHLRRCDGSTAEQQIIQVLSQSPGELRPILIELMMDEGRSIVRRTQAAVALGKTPEQLTSQQAAIHHLLLARDRERGRDDIPGQAAEPLPHSAVVGNRLFEAIGRCDGEGGARARKPGGLSSRGDSADEDMSECLRERLCGPGLDRYQRAMQICCRYAYGRRPPEWCQR